MRKRSFTGASIHKALLLLQKISQTSQSKCRDLRTLQASPTKILKPTYQILSTVLLRFSMDTLVMPK